MKVAFFMGFLVCLNLAFTDAAINNERIQLLQRLLQRFDPFTIRDVSLVLSDDISVSLKSAVIANLSNFDLPQDDEVGNNINATIFIPSVSYNVDRLSISSKKLGIQYALPSLRAVVGGVSLAVSHSFSHNPLKMETFLILAQISDLSVSN
ncbi:uncharacterized protein LOC108740139 [Agrilus planipennis]|uniref:Uncharacterized protein LOC108740139 n=1 Tax=Agrilus planipennis TaxID=224129 RepID=A0A1W4XBQ7_AGRPL|nr:uncharacterized protein LOC108740139 [Agrilus planipennis]